jgi:hypothetical protein
MLQPLGSVTITNTTVSKCQAWQNGGGLCTEMWIGNEDDYRNNRDISSTEFQYDLRTQLIIGPNTTFEDNNGTGRHLFVGPYFNLTFQGHATPGGKPSLNETSVGVFWRKRVCGKGEYAALSGFCEPCSSYTYRPLDKPHRADSCTPAPNNTHSPGGAILVPLAHSWHLVRPATEPRTCAARSSDSCTAAGSPYGRVAR